MAEVEDVALGGGALGEDAADLAVDDVPAGEQQRRVEVALQRPARPHAGGGDVQRQPPVDPDDVGAGLAHRAQQLAGADPEVDARQAGVGQPLQHAGGVREHQLAVVALRERTGPGVEELHGVDAGVDLGAQERQRRVGEGGAQRVPGVRLGVHQRLGALVVAARAALHEVGREGERRAREADERGVAELADEQPHRVGHRRDALGVQRRQGGDVGGRAHRLLHDGTGAGDDVDPDPGGLERHDDVGEEDRGVDAVAADGLQRDLAGEIGGQAGLEHPGALAELAVLGQRAPGLTHEPHGAPGRALATGRPRGTGRRAGGVAPLRSACRLRWPCSRSPLPMVSPSSHAPGALRRRERGPPGCAAGTEGRPRSLPVGRAGRVVDEGRTGPLGVGGAGKNPFGLLSSR